MYQATVRKLVSAGLLVLVSLVARAQKEQLSDAELTANLISAPGPTFRIPASQIPTHWTIVAYGDMRFTDPRNEKVANPKVRRWLVDKLAAEHPDAVLLSGDVPYDGSVKNDYDVFRSETAAWRQDNLRVYPAIGNHELHGEEAREPDNWWSAFASYKGRRWYSVEFRNVYILSLDSDLALTEGSRQQKWLVDQLHHLPKVTRFVFVSLHHPPVADSIEGNSSHDVRPNEHALAVLLEEEAKRSHAKFIVVAGHIHNYQRFYENGVVYLVSGGGGAKPYPIARTSADLFQDPVFPNYHYLKFAFDGEKIVATMNRVVDPAADKPAFEVRDKFVIGDR